MLTSNSVYRCLAFGSLIPLLYAVAGCGVEKMDPLNRPLKSHSVDHTDSTITIDGKLDESAWESATDVGPFEFPWESGARESTIVKLLWNDTYLYVSFVCEDTNISAEHTERDSPVYRDDCVEVFTSPNPEQLEKYFNVEMNARAAHLDFFHPEGPGSKEAWDPDIKVATTFDGTLNDESDTDHSWTLEVAIPWNAFSEAAKNIPPHDGDEWRMNFNRLGDKTNPEKSQWSPGDPDNPSFHAPLFFGRVSFKK